MHHEQPTPRQALTIRLFGGMAIEDPGGANLLPRSKKTRAVVAILALTAPRATSRAQLALLLWSQRESEHARASLRQTVHELQSTLGPTWSGVLLAERHSLAMDTRYVVVDGLAAIGPAASKTALLTLFQDGFLDDLRGLDPAFDNWLTRERQRLAKIACLLGEAFLTEPHPGSEIIETARALLRIDRGHDGAWQAVIQAFIDTGDRAAALLTCEQWREAIGLTGDQPLPPEITVLLSEISTGVTQRRIPAKFDQSQTAGGQNPGAGRSGLSGQSVPRLGVREMRVSGPAVDQGLPIGLAEAIITELSRFHCISCVSGSSLAAMAGQTGEADLHWSDIDLDLILDGTIQCDGNRVRVMARLLDMRVGGAIIWAYRFNHDSSDILCVQEGVAASIAARLDPILLMREGERAAARGPHGALPGDLVLKAVPAIYRLDRMSFHAAGDMLEAALQADPVNIDALAWFAYWHLFLVGQGWAGDPEAATARAGRLADTAVAMDPNDARALTLAGHVRGFLMKRPAEAVALHERAISLNPNLAIAWCFSGFALCYLGDHDAALSRMRQAIELSPSDPHLFFFQAAIIMPFLLRGDYGDAAAAGRRAIELNPWFSSSLKGHLAVLGHLNYREEAADIVSRLLNLEPRFNVADAIRRSPMNLPRDVERYAQGLRLAGLPEG